MECSDAFFDFIVSHSEEDPDRLLLKGGSELNSDFLKFAVLQIALRKKFASKFPRLLANAHFLFPDRSVGEQASSEATASYISLIAADARSVADLTAGLGVNAISFAENTAKVTAVELSKERAEILQHNLNVLDIRNVMVECCDCKTWLDSLDQTYDLAFIDPARRDERGIRSISLEHHSPDVLQLMPVIKEKVKRLLVKVSPLFDLGMALKEIPAITAFHLVEYKGECKELILDIDFKKEGTSPTLRCVEVFENKPPVLREYQYGKEDTDIGKFVVRSEAELKDFSFLYIPSPSIRKARIEDKLLLQYSDLKLLSVNTMLFVSSRYYEDFPGKVLNIEGIMKKKDLNTLKGTQCNVLARNYPISSEALASRYKFKPSGAYYLIATTLSTGKILLLCRLKSQ